MIHIRNKRWGKAGQTAVEWVAIVTIVIGALVAFSSYFKRGLSGRWKSIMDDVGDQYDPRIADSRITHTFSSNTATTLNTFDVVNGIWTLRIDQTNSVEHRDGETTVGAFSG